MMAKFTNNTILTLDNKSRYLIICSTRYDGDIYYYLSNINRKNDVMICKEAKTGLDKIIDQRVIKVLLPLLLNELCNILNQN